MGTKFNRRGLKPRNAAVGPVRTAPVADTRTFQGAPGFSRDAKSDLFLLGMNNMTAERAFYETAEFRDGRFTALVQEVACNDPLWLAGYLPWLRTVGNMRTAPVIAAADAVRAMAAHAGHDGALPGGKAIVNSVLHRADEPGVILGYDAQTYGGALPVALRKGVALACARLYTEKSMVRYDTESHAYRPGRVIQLCHPVPDGPAQSALFKVLLDRAYKRDDISYAGMPMLAADAALRMAANSDPRVVANTERLRAAGWRHLDALPYAGKEVTHRQLWEAVWPVMGYEALLGNLAAMDRAGVSDEVAEKIAAKLRDPHQVRRAQLFPFRFLSAYEQAPSLRWGHALELAMRECTRNVPQLPGSTLILVDTSVSMQQVTLSAKSKMTPAKAAAVFGVALAHGQANAQLYGFSDQLGPEHKIGTGASVLKEITSFLQRNRPGGTDITGALRGAYRNHDRVVIITDEQSHSGYDMSVVPAHVPIYSFNLCGYAAGYLPLGPNRHSLGGLTDATFQMIPMLERGKSVTWPWESPAEDA